MKQVCKRHNREWDDALWACCPQCAEYYVEEPPETAKKSWRNIFCFFGLHNYRRVPGYPTGRAIMRCTRCGDSYEASFV